MNPTTRSWTPPRTFFTQVRFLGPGEKPPRPGSPTPPSGPENAGQNGQKSRPPGQLSGRPGGPPKSNRAAWVETSQKRGKPGPPAGRKTGPESRPRDHPEPSETTGSGSPATSKIPRHILAPARRTVSPARAEDPVEDLQPTARARRRRRKEGPVKARTPGQLGAPTHPAGAGKRGTPPPARGSPTSSGRKNQTASSRPRRRDAPASPQTSRQVRCWRSPALRSSGPTHLPSDPAQRG